ncbi:MAG: Rap1a/Tai family immunity protein [Pseudomonadota bacterium]
MPTSPTHPTHRARRAWPLAALGLASGLGLAALPAGAADEQVFMIDTTGDLARLCGASQVHPNYAAAVHMCHGYIIGIHHFHEAMAQAVDDDIYCEEKAETPPTRAEVEQAFVAWVEANPEAAEMEALDGVLTFAAQAFPCE